MESKDKREWMSALADGQLQGDDFARGMALAADAQALDAWHTYHLIGDVLRSSDLAAASPADAFLARFEARLAVEAAPLAVVAAVQAPALVPAPAPVREAANDGAFRWKLVAGFASVAAVGAIGWSVFTGTGAGSRGAELASAAGPAVVVGSERGPVIRDARLDELLAAHRQLAGTTAPQAFLRNATYDASGR